MESCGIYLMVFNRINGVGYLTIAIQRTHPDFWKITKTTPLDRGEFILAISDLPNSLRATQNTRPRHSTGNIAIFRSDFSSACFMI